MIEKFTLLAFNQVHVGSFCMSDTKSILDENARALTEILNIQPYNAIYYKNMSQCVVVAEIHRHIIYNLATVMAQSIIVYIYSHHNYH